VAVEKGSEHLPSANFWLSENIFLVGTFSSRNAKLEAEKLPFWGI